MRRAAYLALSAAAMAAAGALAFWGQARAVTPTPEATGSTLTASSPGA